MQFRHVQRSFEAINISAHNHWLFVRVWKGLGQLGVWTCDGWMAVPYDALVCCVFRVMLLLLLFKLTNCCCLVFIVLLWPTTASSVVGVVLFARHVGLV